MNKSREKRSCLLGKLFLWAETRSCSWVADAFLACCLGRCDSGYAGALGLHRNGGWDSSALFRSEVRVGGVSGREGVRAIGLGAFRADAVESSPGHEGSTTFEALTFNSGLLPCQGTAAMISVSGQKVPPRQFLDQNMQKMYHSRYF